MKTNLLKKILNHELDSATTIVTHSNNEPHVSNTWNSFITITEDDKLLIPVGGMVQTEKNISENNKIILSICNRVVDGFNYPGTGVVIKGNAKVLASGNEFEVVKKKFSWIRAVLIVEMTSINQTM